MKLLFESLGNMNQQLIAIVMADTVVDIPKFVDPNKIQTTLA